MAQLNDLLVLGKANIKGSIKANGDHEFLYHGNEFTFVPPGYNGDIYFNYRTASGASDGSVNAYRFSKGNANHDLSDIYAATIHGALDGNATSANYLRDKNNGTATYMYYSSAGMESSSWYAAWDGYTLRAIAPDKLATHLATNTLDGRYVNVTGDSMSGRLSVNVTNNTTGPTGQSIVLNGVTDSTDTGLAPGIGFHIGNKNWGSLKFLSDGSFRFFNSDCSGYMRTYVGGLTSTSYISLPTGAGVNNASANYISAGRGYSTTSGKNGLKLLCTEQDDCHSGMGQDCTGKSYELSIAAGLGTSGQGYITFVGHKIGTPTTYSELGYFDFTNSLFKVNGNIITSGQLKGAAYSGGSWISGRSRALIRTEYSTSGSSFAPIFSVKTQSGSWDCGPCHPNEHLYFSYATDANFSAGTNTTTSSIYFTNAGYIYGARVYNAVWNDYAEFREANTIEPGRVVIEGDFGIMKKSTERLQSGGSIVSDTYGHAMGETEKCKTPIALAGRVLAYPYEDRESYPIGAAVCTGPNGTISLMTREEIKEYPERIVGIVSEIPDYDGWGPENILVNGRIWIKVK